MDKTVVDKPKAKKSADTNGNLTPEERFKRSMKKAKKRKKERAQQGNYVKSLAPGEKIRVRVMPPVGNMDSFFFECGLHGGFKIADKNRMLPCRNVTPIETGDCPVCEFIDALMQFREGLPEKHKKAVNDLVWGRDGIKQQMTNYVNVAILEKTGIKSQPYKSIGKVKILKLAAKNVDKLTTIMGQEDYGDITSPTDGHDIVYEKGTDRDKMSPYELTPMGLSYDIEFPDWEKQTPDLTKKVLTVMSREEMLTHLHANFAEEIEMVEDLLDWTEEEKHPKKAKKSKNRLNPKDDEEDDDE